jgi:uncharacterized protein YndB with AHSA1/START domain
MNERKTRSIEMERTLAATPDDVWEALTTDEGLRRWFPLDAKVEPGVGGTVWLSWGPGCEGEAPIHIWEPGRRVGWTEDYGEDESGRPIKVAVDFHIEGRDGSTVVRLVQSGFSASSKWDDMYDALVDGWAYFMFNLAFYFLKHAGTPRRLVWKRAPTELSRDVAWDRLVGAALIGAASAGVDDDAAGPDHGAAEADRASTRRGGSPAEITVVLDQEYAATVVSTREGHHFAAALPHLNDSAFFVELEGSHIGFWLSTYGIDEARVDTLQRSLDERIEVALRS